MIYQCQFISPDLDKYAQSTYEYPVQCFRVARRGEDAGVLHVCFQIPKLPQTDSLDVYNVCRVRHWYLRMRSL